MKTDEIKPGMVYVERSGVARYVISTTPAEGRKQPRVTWRRVGQYADKSITNTLAVFASEVIREQPDMRVDPAPALPNNGMATA